MSDAAPQVPFWMKRRLVVFSFSIMFSYHDSAGVWCTIAPLGSTIAAGFIVWILFLQGSGPKIDGMFPVVAVFPIVLAGREFDHLVRIDAFHIKIVRDNS